MNIFLLAIRYLKYRFRAGNEHGLHSPFVFDLYCTVIKPRNKYYVFSTIEYFRKKLLNSEESLTVLDLGAGSRIKNTKVRKIKDIVRIAEKPPRIAQLLFRLVAHFKPAIILDLGTSIGLTTLYLALASSQNKVYTFEGCPETSAFARKNFDRFNLKNVTLITGNIDNTLEPALRSLDKVDFIFFDANHRYGPTLNYFNLCLEKAHDYSLFVFDDIHWSGEMERAWEQIKKHDKVMLTIDLFYIGLVFFRPGQPKQHFTLRI